MALSIDVNFHLLLCCWVGNTERKEDILNCCRPDSIGFKYTNTNTGGVLCQLGNNKRKRKEGKNVIFLCYDTATLCVAMCLWCQPWPVFFICPPGRAESRWFPIDSTHGDRWICNRHFKPTQMNFNFKFTSRL